MFFFRVSGYVLNCDIILARTFLLIEIETGAEYIEWTHSTGMYY